MLSGSGWCKNKKRKYECRSIEAKRKIETAKRKEVQKRGEAKEQLLMSGQIPEESENLLHMFVTLIKAED